MVLYHGTTVPLESIRSRGLLVYHPDWVRDLILKRLSQPDRYLRYVRRGIKSLGKGPLGTYNLPGLYFCTVKELAEAYVWTVPEELSYSFIMATPRGLRKALLEAIVEVRGDRLIGKLVTVGVPQEWRDLPGVEWREPDDIMIPFNVGPQYITRIELSSTSWSDVLGPYMEI